MPQGYLSIFLHGHLPFVRNTKIKDSLEERWLFEAITECYVPLLQVFDKLTLGGVAFRITFSLSPTLISMLVDDLLRERYLTYIDNLINLAHRETQRTRHNQQENHLAYFYLDRLLSVREYYYKCQGNLLLPFKRLSEEGRLELVTTGATHGYLPLMSNDIARRAQVEAGLSTFVSCLGLVPAGFWLPECGFVVGVDAILKEAGLKYFLVDGRGLQGGVPAPINGTCAPVITPAGVYAFGRDMQSSSQVWDRNIGYPGDGLYREFYRDIGYDLELDYLGDCLPGGIRVDTGLKYYRITGSHGPKELYHPASAKALTAKHAVDFINARKNYFGRVNVEMDRPPLAVAPYDAELFGHWWFEGPHWLENVILKTASDKDIKLISPSDYIEMHPNCQQSALPMSSWGEGGYSYVWLNPDNDWIYPHQHRAEAKMSELADLNPSAENLTARALNQAAVQLLLAQSSDWAFIMKERTVTSYAAARVTEHLSSFNLLSEMVETGTVDEAFLGQLKERDNIFEGIDYRLYSSKRISPEVITGSVKRVAMFSWEFPPSTVGGLSRHVYDISRALAGLGVEVHVFTCPAPEVTDEYCLEKGLYVHRVSQQLLASEDFMLWLGELNRGMMELARDTIRRLGDFDIIHAHDWLVKEAAGEMAKETGTPLVVTIHATEHGRNRGIFNDLQRTINNVEMSLVREADGVITCSNYMADEVCRLFEIPRVKVAVIPNGVDPESVKLNPGEPVKYGSRSFEIVFLGRLVPEKGVQILIQALPFIAESIPQVKLLVAGRGPYEEELVSQAWNCGVLEKVSFVGFVDDNQRNEMLSRAGVAVFPSLYEPFGIVALEAMAAGVPVVISDTGGLSDIVNHGVDGYKAPPGQPELLAMYIKQILLNPALAEEFARNSMRRVLTKYDWRIIAYETGKVYLGAIGDRSYLAVF